MYEADAQKIIGAIAAIKKAAEDYNVKSTMFTMVAMGEAIKLLQETAVFTNLPKDQRDEFLASCWDQAIGTEQGALVHAVGFLSPEATEQVSDALATAALGYFNRTVPAPA